MDHNKSLLDMQLSKATRAINEANFFSFRLMLGSHIRVSINFDCASHDPFKRRKCLCSFFLYLDVILSSLCWMKISKLILTNQYFLISMFFFHISSFSIFFLLPL